MKAIYRNFFIGTAFAVLASGLASCDDVKPDDRYILGEEIKVERAVLLEDFTGQMCVNCPEAHEVIEQLEQQFGRDKVIAVSIHCGAFGISTDRTRFDAGMTGLMTAEGNAIMEAYGINSFPMGVIDMGRPQTFDLWPTAVRNALQVSTDVKIDMTVNYTPGTDDTAEKFTGTIDIKAVVESGSDRLANVQFWVVENEIVALQRNLSTTVRDYVHNNVFRGQAFPGIRGSEVALTKGIDTEVTASLANRWSDTEHWNVNNLSIVAFVSDKSGVLQVTRVPLVEKPEEPGDESDPEE